MRKCQKSKIFKHVRKRRFLTKAQMEMMGLALIIILVSIALLFVVRFVILEKPAEHKKQFTESELASNFISTLLKTSNPNCRDLRFEEIFQDVAEKYPHGPYTNCYSDVDSYYGVTEDYLPEKLNEILGNTFEIWHINYGLVAETSAETIIYDSKEQGESILPFGAGCPGARESKEFPLPVDAAGATTLFIRLDVCS